MKELARTAVFIFFCYACTFRLCQLAFPSKKAANVDSAMLSALRGRFYRIKKKIRAFCLSTLEVFRRRATGERIARTLDAEASAAAAPR
jgi:hypothetical protein